MIQENELLPEKIVSLWNTRATSIIPEGFALVPIEPTQNMMDEGRKNYAAVWVEEKGGTSRSCLRYGYQAMLAAAPPVTLKTEAEVIEQSQKTNWQADRVEAWIRDKNRKPAHLSFTEGPERNVCYAIEELMAEVRKTAMVEALEWAESEALKFVVATTHNYPFYKSIKIRREQIEMG